MRFVAVGFGIAALLATTAASATGGVGGKGDTGGKGGLGPANSTSAGAAGTAEQTTTGADFSQQAFGGQSTQSPDVVGGRRIEEKPWEVGATFETHRLIRQDYNLDGVGAVKVFNVLFAVAKYNLTDNDQFLLSGGGYQYFLADSGEPGFRASDLSLAYTRQVLLPQKFRLRATGALTAPISFDSQLAGNITTPSLSVALSRKFGDLAVEARLTGRYYWDKAKEATALGSSSGDPGGQPNVKYTAGGSISAEYNMPFFRPLSAGAALTDLYVWYYTPGGCVAQQSGLSSAFGMPVSSSNCPATSNSGTDNQPMQQSYGGEVFVRYAMPDLGGFKSDVTAVFANGDPSLGFPSVIHDGVTHPYFFYWNTTELYLALNGRY
jgi:hypothetical protein